MKKISTSLLTFLLISNAHALTLRESIEKTISTNPKILASQKKQDAFRKYVDEEKADYFPTIDLESYYEHSYKYTDANNTPSEHDRKGGWNAALNLEQVLYDGGLTSSEVTEQRHTVQSNDFKTTLDIETIILDTTKSFLDVVQYGELINLSDQMIALQQQNLTTAKEQKAISGEKLEVLQVLSKIHSTKDKYYGQEASHMQATNAFKTVSGITTVEQVCRPHIDRNLIPTSLEKTLKEAIKKHYAIKEQIEEINIQREKVAQSNAQFLPTISFKLEGEWDNDLALFENGRQYLYKSQIFMSWNLSKGGKNLAQTQKEKLFLQEAKKTLDATTAEVIADITDNFNNYHKTQQQIDVLKLLIEDNTGILNIYRKEFDAGTRTFIDILNAEAEVYSAKTSLINAEFKLYEHYYSLLLDLSVLSDHILSQKKTQCHNTSIKLLESINNNTNKELEQLFQEEDISTPKQTSSDSLSAVSAIQADSKDAQVLDEVDIQYTDNKSKPITSDEKNLTQNTLSLDENQFDQLKTDQQDIVRNNPSTKSQNIIEDSQPVISEKKIEPPKAQKNLETVQTNNTTPSNSSTTVKASQVIPDKITTQPTQNSYYKNIVLSPFIRFIDAPSNYFTINITTKKEKLDALFLLNKYNLDEGYTFEFGEKLDNVQVLHGVYPTSSSAKADLDKFDSRLIKKYSPYVDTIEKYQQMYQTKQKSSLKTIDQPNPITYKAIEQQQTSTTIAPMLQQFIDAPSTYFTINVSTQQEILDALYILNRYNINKEGYIFKFGDALEKVKVLHGVYSSSKEARESLNQFDSELMKKYSPYVENINKYQTLYHKAHTAQSTSSESVLTSEKSDNIKLTATDMILAPSNYFTLNLATKKSKQKVFQMVKEYKIPNSIYTYNLGGENEGKIKVLYGVYPDSKTAKKALNKLNKTLLKHYRPYVDNINKHQKLYKKYQSIN